MHGEPQGQSLALLTDLYQLTMAYGYWKSQTANKQAVFHLFFRKSPFAGGFTICCGLSDVIRVLNNFRFDEDDIEYLASLTGNDGRPLFERGFLRDLGNTALQCDVDAIPEGTVVFPHEPLLRVRGSLLQCQILETILLNIVNFQSLIATKSARICQAAQGDAVLEFGLRRAQGTDGALSASRAAYIGGCAATSNLMAGKRFDIPVKGTHAHSWVMSFDSEMEAFQTYADAMPNNCVFLVDTYDTLAGVRHAVEVGRRLRQSGHEMVGIRLDSGDLAYLSIEARKILDDAGFTNAAIVASNDLDEHLIASLKEQGATISVWGVGTKLATAYDQPALGGVYKLAAIREPDGEWLPKIKLSEQTIKVSNPGPQQVRRFHNNDGCLGDVIYGDSVGIATPAEMIDPLDPTRRHRLPADAIGTDLLVPVFRNGQCCYTSPTIHEIRQRVQQQLAGFHAGIKRRHNPHQYPVGLDPQLHELKTRLILAAREGNS